MGRRAPFKVFVYKDGSREVRCTRKAGHTGGCISDLASPAWDHPCNATLLSKPSSEPQEALG
jgi:hypothetical protein